MTLPKDLRAARGLSDVPTPAGGGVSNARSSAAALESIGHLQKKIELMWGTPELDVFVSRLIMDSRDGTRQGLPMEIATELLFLAEVNKMVRAIDTAKRLTLNLREAYRLVDKGDQSRLESDALDNPLVSHDTITRQSAARQATSAAVLRREESADGLVARFWRGLFKLIGSKLMIYCIIVAVGIKLAWPKISGMLPAFLN
ncbi:MAG: hypothetical protein Q8O52_18740 [Sulfuritalea sp.]|nr:hypothetical protein [Sulfuritalea sp.]